MYKVFVNEKPLCFSEIPVQGVNNVKYDNNSTFDIAIDRLENTPVPSLNIFYHNLDKLWGNFTHYYGYIEAAGGIVKNEKEEILFIRRHNKWDLPKGKVEENESLETTALREIGEECGVYDLEIKNFLITTYHIYKIQKYMLKATHWYLMQTTKPDVQLVPQTEEGIEAVVWKGRDEIKEAEKDTFQNIKLLLNYYQENYE